MSKPTMITTGTAMAGTRAIGPPIIQITAMNRAINGRSTRVARVAEAKNSRTVSNSRKVLAKPPAEEAGRAAI